MRCPILTHSLDFSIRKAYNKRKTVRGHIPPGQEVFHMQELLTTLREKNPGLPFYSVNDPEFKLYGRKVDLPMPGFTAVLESLPGAEVRLIFCLGERLSELAALAGVTPGLPGLSP